ncbi:YadA family autotransporter adhesin [Neisseria subflava]|uniref:YadA family autotransporter adhesin n=1 Tax=Neisseria subflava TaxID=28449 RepID=UPI003D8107E4
MTITDGDGNTTTTIISDGKDGKNADGKFGLRDEDGEEIPRDLNKFIQIKGGDTLTENGQNLGKNISVKKVGEGDNAALEVSLKPNLTVNSVTANKVTTNELKAGPVTINKDGIDAGNTTIQNVAPGKKGTDAVNVDQLNQKFGDVNSNVNKVDNNARAGVAQALATAGLPQAYLPGKSMLAIGGGHYRGETGYAVGFSSISDGGNWIIKGTASGNSRGHFGATAAVGYQW